MSDTSTANDQYQHMVSVGYPGAGESYVVLTGWQCPRCKKINNPTLDQCPCEPPTCVTITEALGSWMREGSWDMERPSPVDFGND